MSSPYSPEMIQRLANLSSDDFAPYLNHTFVIHFGQDDRLDVQLNEVKVHGESFKKGGRKPFSVFFVSILRDRYLPQGTYWVEHPSMGKLAYFLSPRGLGESGMLYEAVFN